MISSNLREKLLESYTCSICFELDDTAVSLNPCGHEFHEDCAKTFLNQKKVCALCQSDVIDFRPAFITREAVKHLLIDLNTSQVKKPIEPIELKKIYPVSCDSLELKKICPCPADELWQLGCFGDIQEKQKEEFNALAKKIDSQKLISFVKQVENKDKSKLIKTIFEIAHQLSIIDKRAYSEDLIYFKKIPSQTFAFALYKDEVLINQTLIGKNTNKVNEVLNLTTLKKDHMRVMVKNESFFNFKCDLVGNALEEFELIQMLEKTNKYIAFPFFGKVLDHKVNPEKLITFQEKFDYSGKALIGSSVPIFHKVAVLKDVAHGLVKLHALGYVHMGVKPSHILINGRLVGNQLVKGWLNRFSMTVKVGEKLKGATPIYLPPEALMIWNDKVIAFKTDISVGSEFDSYALGVTIIEILLGFDQISNKKTIGAYSDHDFANLYKEFEYFVEKNQASDFVKQAYTKLFAIAIQLVRPNPINRMTTLQAADHLSLLYKTFFPES